MIAGVVGKSLQYEMVDFHSSRPGHDIRYSLEGTKFKIMDFDFSDTFEDSLKKSVNWYLKHDGWYET